MAEIQENPIISFFSNLLRGIKLPLPKNDAAVEPDGVSPAAELVEKKPAATEDGVDKPTSATFPTQTFTPLKFESESVEAERNTNPILLSESVEAERNTNPILQSESVEAERNTNPILLWQVCAIGGFFILRWAWTRWNERKSSKKPDNKPPTDRDDL